MLFLHGDSMFSSKAKRFCFCAVLLFAGFAFQGHPAMGGDGESDLLRSIADGLQKGLAVKAGEIAAIERNIPQLQVNLSEDLAKISRHLDQLLLLRGVAGETPWASRTLLMQLTELHGAVTRIRQPLEDVQETLDHVRREYAALRQMRLSNASREYADMMNEELAGPGKDYKELKRIADGIRQEVDGSLKQAEALSEDIKTAGEQEIGHFIEVFKQTYCASSGTLLRLAGLSGALEDGREWLHTAPRFWGPVAAWTPWRSYLGAAAAFFTIGLGVFAGLARKRPRLRAEAGPGAVWIAAGLALFAAWHVVPLAGSQFTALLWVALVSLGCVLWVRRGLALSVLCGCFLVATAMDAANLPASVIGLPWALCMAAAVWRLRRESGRLPATAVVLIASGLCGLLGYGPQAVMAVQALFMLYLTVGVASAVQRVLAEEAGGKTGSWGALVAPLAVTVLAALYVAWILVFMGGPGLLEHVFAWKMRIGQAVFTLDAATTLVVVFFALRLLLAWLRGGLGFVNYRGRRMDQGMSHTVGAACSYVAWTLFILFSLHLFEVPLDALTWIASGLSVGIGFGLKDIVNNFVSGLIIMFGGAVKKGDIIQQGKAFGEVVDLSVRNTIMRTLDNTTVIIPNSSFLRGEIVNLSYQDASIRLTIPVTVAPGTKIAKVRKLMLAIAKEHPDVLAAPPPEVFMHSIGRAGLEFDLHVWIDKFIKKFQVQSELATAIDQRFQENKILVPFQGVKVKYKPKGTEEMQLEAQREELRRRRVETMGKMRRLRRVHVRRRWPAPPATAASEE